jgi:hypothetical protein
MLCEWLSSGERKRAFFVFGWRTPEFKSKIIISFLRVGDGESA